MACVDGVRYDERERIAKVAAASKTLNVVRSEALSFLFCLAKFCAVAIGQIRC